MKVKIGYDFEEHEYIAFVDKIPNISGYGVTEKEAIVNLLEQAKKEEGFNHDVITRLIEIINNEN